MAESRIGSPAAHCRIFTFREGVLSRLGHDLEFDVREFSITVTREGAVEGTFELASLKLLGAVADGRTTALSRTDHETIERTTASEVLQSARFGTVGLHGSYSRATNSFEGTCTLHGVTRPVRAEVRWPPSEEETLTITVDMRPSEYGIPPYRAMFGALKLQDRVRVSISMAQSLARDALRP